MAETKGAKTGDGPVVIKKYANRRLYNTASSTYVTLEHLADMVRKGVDFVVYDAKTNDDITRSVLAQIIFYGNSMQAFLPSYLEMSLASFAEQQERLRQQFSGMSPPAGLAAYEDQVKKNMALFSQAMQMFSPFAYGRPEGAQAEQGVPVAGAPDPAAAPAGKASDEAIAELTRRMEERAAQIDRLASGR
jgi:polyhydroxyalkanoate synthesis regulator protein